MSELHRCNGLFYSVAYTKPFPQKPLILDCFPLMIKAARHGLHTRPALCDSSRGDKTGRFRNDVPRDITLTMSSVSFNIFSLVDSYLHVSRRLQNPTLFQNVLIRPLCSFLFFIEVQHLTCEVA